jgi:Flp pilus assembly protein TadB
MNMGKRESFGSTLDKELLNDLRSLSEDTGIPISKLLDKAVRLLLEKQGMKRNNKMYIDINLDE